MQLRLAAALAHIYPSAVRAAANALARGESVLVSGPALLAQPFVESLQLLQSELQPQDFHVVSLADAREIASPVRDLDDPSIDSPSQLMLRHSFQRQLYNRQTSDVILVVDFLDTLLAAPGPELVDTITLLNSFPEQRLLAFGEMANMAPPVLHTRLPRQVELPRLDRESLWGLLFFDEVQNIFGATLLSVAHQVALFHALGRLHVFEARSLVSALGRESAMTPTRATATPFQAIATLASWARRREPPPRREAPALPEAVAEMRRSVLEPLAQYQRAESAAAVHAIDLTLLRGTLVVGTVQAAADRPPGSRGSSTSRCMRPLAQSWLQLGLEHSLTRSRPCPPSCLSAILRLHCSARAP